MMQCGLDMRFPCLSGMATEAKMKVAMEHYLDSSECIDWAAAKGMANCLFIKEWKQV
jgi:hypothetical protein